jgi:hypothetical protein
VKRVLLITAIVLGGPAIAHADGLESRVMVIPVTGSAPSGLGSLVEDVEQALAEAATQLTPNVSHATASLEDTAVLVGCEPSEATCLDAIAAALNVDQLLIADVTSTGRDATIAVTAVTRDTEPVRREFVIHKATRGSDLSTLRAAVPVMLEAGETRKAEAAAGKRDRDPPDRAVEPPSPPVAPVVTASHHRSRAPLYTIGSGAALIVIVGVFWTLADGRQQAIDAAPTATADDLEALANLEASARVRASVGNVLVIGGAAVAAAGLAWYVLDHRRRHDEGVRVGPTVVPGGAGVTLGGAW